MNRTDPIGFFDSGLGGISVLQRARQLLPNEDYIYYGDCLHAPYGVRPVEEVEALCADAAEHLLAQGVKAIVLACNTATSAAAASLRRKYPDIPIIGTEPALKPAVERHPGGRILVMATEMTLKEQKFLDLWAQFREQAEIVPVPCSGLMEFVERGELESMAVEAFLQQLLSPHLHKPVDAVILGCTHYPFLRRAICRVTGGQAELLDSADGVSRQLRRVLEERKLLQTRTILGQVHFQYSGNDPNTTFRAKNLLAYCPEER